MIPCSEAKQSTSPRVQTFRPLVRVDLQRLFAWAIRVAIRVGLFASVIPRTLSRLGTLGGVDCGDAAKQANTTSIQTTVLLQQITHLIAAGEGFD